MDHAASRISLDDNAQFLVDNPLRDKSPEELDRQAAGFAIKVGADKKLFIKAARIAQDPLDWHTVDRQLGLSDHERRSLQHERTTGFWGQTKSLKVTVITLCFSAIIQGWIQTGINGANQTWPQEFGLINPETQSWVNERSKWIYAAVNAVTFLAGSIFGCWLSDPLQSVVIVNENADNGTKAVLGRRGAILISCCLCFAALVGSACSHTWQQLLGCRALLGIGMGSKASVTPIFGAEVSPSHLRGALVMNWQLFDACGIFLGFTANLILYRIGPLSWRFQVASACIPTICLLTLIWTIPESPRWLLKQGRFSEAFKAMCEIRETPLLAAREIFYANAQLQIEVSLLPTRDNDEEDRPTQIIPRHAEQTKTLSRVQTVMSERSVGGLTNFQKKVQLTNYWSRIVQLFRNKRTRRATLAAGVVMICQQLCGINVLAFYSSTFFRDVNHIGADRDKAVWLSWGVGLANFVFTIPAFRLIESPNGRAGGRRFLLLATYPGMILAMLAACLSFFCPTKDGRLVLIGLFMFLFVLFYSMGQGPVAFAYSSEVFPLVYREAGMSFAVFINFFGAGLLTLFVPLAQTSTRTEPSSYDLAQTKLLAIFVCFGVIAFFLIFFFVPETAIAEFQRDEGYLIPLSLEELNFIFGVRTREHIQYQIGEMVPYTRKLFMYFLIGQFRGSERPEHPKRLYRWAEDQAQLRELRGVSHTQAVHTNGSLMSQVYSGGEGGAAESNGLSVAPR